MGDPKNPKEDHPVEKPVTDSSPKSEAATLGPATGAGALPSDKPPSPVALEGAAGQPSPGEAAESSSSADVGSAPPQTSPVAGVPGDAAEEFGDDVRAAFEHPWVVRFCHWLNAISMLVMIASGLRIFRAFPSFGPKLPQNNLVDIPKALTLGGWLGGALQWHFTFMWIFVTTGILYLVYEFASGHYRTILFTLKDIRGVWPMARHYFLFGPEPPATEQYNPLQKLAYTSTILLGVASVLTGIVIYKPIQLWWLAWMMGGFHLARIWHFLAMCGFLAFIPGHLIMVILHGWNNFASMLTGWKRDPGYPTP